MILDIRDMNEYNPRYTEKQKALKWKKINDGANKKKQFHTIEIKDILITKKAKQSVEEENLKGFREQYMRTHELIPVLLRPYDHKLLRGYEQILVAQELGVTEVPYIEHTEKSVNRKAFCTKQVAIVDCTGKQIYISKQAKAKINECRTMCRKLGLKLEIVPIYRFKVYDNTGNCLWKKDGFVLNDLYKKLKKKIASIEPKQKESVNA